MKVVVLYGINDMRFEDIEIKLCESDEVKIKVMVVGICGLDFLRVLKYWKYLVLVILGYEFFGVIVEVGKDVKNVKVGDRVVVIFFIFCNECEYCKRGLFLLCDNYGMLGVKSFGVFVEYVNIKVINVFLIGDMNFEDVVMIELLVVVMYGVFNIGV